MKETDFRKVVGELSFAFRQFCLNRLLHKEIDHDLYVHSPITWNTLMVSLEMGCLLGAAKVLERKYFERPFETDDLEISRKKICKLRNGMIAHLNLRDQHSLEVFLNKHMLTGEEITKMFIALIDRAENLKKIAGVQENLKAHFVAIKKEVDNEFDKWVVFIKK